jgi:hypothetical protein
MKQQCAKKRHSGGRAVASGPIPAHQGQAEAGIAGGGFDDGAAGAQAAIPLGGVDHGQANAVLDGAAGVLGFKLEEQRARAGIEAADPHQRGIANQFEHGGAGSGGHVVTWLRKGRMGWTAAFTTWFRT